MKQLLWRLDYLCIEIISINIHRYSRISRDNWLKTSLQKFGDKLILATIANSYDNGLDETAYEFILNNFYTENLKIFLKLFEKIQYFDFLNGMSMKKLEIDLLGDLRLRNSEEEFQISTDTLFLSIKKKDNFFTKSFRFFSKVIVKEELFINVTEANVDDKMEMERSLLTLLKNTSEKIEKIQVFYENPTKCFIEEYMRILIDKKNIKSFSNERFKPLIHFVLESSYTKTYNYLPLLNIEKFDEYLRALNSIESINFWLPTGDNMEKKKNYFLYLQSMNLKNLKDLEVTCINCYGFVEEFRCILENCPNLVNLSLCEGS